MSGQRTYDLDQLSEKVLSNPFGSGWSVAHRQLVRALQPEQVMRELRARAESGKIREGGRLLIAWRFAEAIEGESSTKSVAPTVINEWKTMYKHLLLEEKRVTRLIRAAAESYRRIGCIKGISDATKVLRMNTWEATLGTDLYRADSIIPHIRRTFVAVHGETGTGKELVAQAVLWGTPVADSFLPLATTPQVKSQEKKHFPAVSANVAALHEGTLESALFGHVKDAFSGATSDKRGLIRRAHEGAMFLDEIGELQRHLQAKLLRVMQEMEVLPMGAETTEPAEVRYVVATNRELTSSGENAAFREDFLQRVSGMVVEVPPLRDRKEDIPELITEITRKAPNAELDVIDGEALFNDGRLQDYDWPGNVRELKNVIRRFLLTGRVELGRPSQPEKKLGTSAIPSEVVACEWTEDQMCRWYAMRSQRLFGLGKSGLSQKLGIHRDTLSRRLSGVVDEHQ